MRKHYVHGLHKATNWASAHLLLDEGHVCRLRCFMSLDFRVPFSSLSIYLPFLRI